MELSEKQKEMIISELTKIRINKGMSAHALSQYCGFSTSMYTRWEQGKMTPSPKSLRQIAEKCGLDIHYFDHIFIGNSSRVTVSKCIDEIILEKAVILPSLSTTECRTGYKPDLGDRTIAIVQISAEIADSADCYAVNPVQTYTKGTEREVVFNIRNERNDDVYFNKNYVLAKVTYI